MAMLLCLTLQAQEPELLVVISNIQKAQGVITIGLFNKEKEFLKKTYRSATVKAVHHSDTLSFKGLPSGEYALSVIHDANRNDKLDTNGFGIPIEGFGFGNDAMGAFGPPSYHKAKVKWEGKTKIVRMKLRYF